MVQKRQKGVNNTVDSKRSKGVEAESSPLRWKKVQRLTSLPFQDQVLHYTHKLAQNNDHFILEKIFEIDAFTDYRNITGLRKLGVLRPVERALFVSSM